MSAVADKVLDAVSAENVARISEGEPEWLREQRAEAWRIFEATPMPTTRLEEWRYTDLSKKLDLDSLGVSQTEAAPDDPEVWPARLRATMDEDREAAGHIVLIDGHVVHVDVDPDLAARGVILDSLHDALELHPDVVQKHLGSDSLQRWLTSNGWPTARRSSKGGYRLLDVGARP